MARWIGSAGRPTVEATISITMNLYSHVLPTMRQEIADSMDAVLAPPNPVADTVADKPTSGPIN